jgi:hypothetical protein
MTKIIVDELGFCVYKSESNTLLGNELTSIAQLGANFLRRALVRKPLESDSIVHNYFFSIITSRNTKITIRKITVAGKPNYALITIDESNSVSTESDNTVSAPVFNSLTTAECPQKV